LISIECAISQAYSEAVRFKEIAMQVPWFFATTPAPQRPAAWRPARRSARRASSLWVRLGERVVAWGEGASHHRLGRWLRP
jgi:hypothetical protein